MRITLIHNPDAGNDQSPSGNELIELIHRAGHAVAYQSSKDENWRSRLEESSDIVAVAGGDGMVGQVAKHLIDRHIPSQGRWDLQTRQSLKSSQVGRNGFS